LLFFLRVTHSFFLPSFSKASGLPDSSFVFHPDRIVFSSAKSAFLKAIISYQTPDLMTLFGDLNPVLTFFYMKVGDPYFFLNPLQLPRLYAAPRETAATISLSIGLLLDLFLS